MEKFKKIFIKSMLVIFAFMLIMSSFMYFQYASDNFDINAFEDNAVETEMNDRVNNSAQTAIAILRVVSAAIAIIMLLVIAMKYMIAAPSDKADIKKHAVAYVIGAFILFGVTQIITLLVEIAENSINK